jgi:hypothetical protein
LEALRRHGVITTTEFEEKRRILLGRL